MTDYGFIRVSTGSQDATTQRRDILAYSPGAEIITTDSRAASASKGEHLDALDRLVARLAAGDRVIVTDSSRLDRDDDQWAQMARLIQVKATGADVVDLSNPGFGGSDRFGVVMTALHQMEAADKSRTVKSQTWRGVKAIMANAAHYGPLPAFWAAEGPRYSKQAVCTNPAAVRDIYRRVAEGESLNSVARVYGLWAQSVKTLVRFEASYSGSIKCRYTHDGQTVEWAHAVEPVVDHELWYRASKRLDVLRAADERKRGGRPVSEAHGWLSGILDCPECGGRLYVNSGATPAGNARTPRLRCGGKGKARQSCRKFPAIPAEAIAEAIDGLMAHDWTPLLAYRRVSGNAHELEELEATRAALTATLSAATDRQERRDALAALEAAEDRIETFTLIPDTFAYTETGQTVAGLWAASDDAAKRAMLKAIKASPWGLELVCLDGEWGVGSGGPVEPDEQGIVDLGAGICFRPPHTHFSRPETPSGYPSIPPK